MSDDVLAEIERLDKSCRFCLGTKTVKNVATPIMPRVASWPCRNEAHELARIARERDAAAMAALQEAILLRERAEKAEGAFREAHTLYQDGLRHADAENARLREALTDYMDHEDSRHDDCVVCDRARAALSGGKEKPDGR